MSLLHTVNEVKFESRPGQDDRISKLAEMQSSLVSALKRNRGRPAINQCVTAIPKDKSVPHKSTSSYALRNSPEVFQFRLNWDWLGMKDSQRPSKQTILKVLLSIPILLKPDRLFAETQESAIYQLRALMCYTGSHYLFFEKGPGAEWVCLNDEQVQPHESWQSVVDLLTNSLCFPRVLVYTKLKQPPTTAEEKAIKKLQSLSGAQLLQIWEDVQDTTNEFDEDEDLLIDMKN